MPNDVQASIALAKEEVLQDMASGRVPRTVPSFSALHDYVDANEYGGLCADSWDWEGDPDYTEANAVQDGVDAWIKAGAPLA